ncbi:hypothetical protein ZIOFF_053133 [Zingiber officinale]|uniref:Uncharacterized protein n=1 Tax=Zingiber officinale TaxID=94328 RepID=A0A8J5FI68_ZINOF|nr:hypothetical protein ZIOFF_053133 [Zingiber officinale]
MATRNRPAIIERSTTETLEPVTSSQEDQIRSYRRMARFRYETQRRFSNARNGSRTLESQLNPEAELELSQRRRASLVPAETLYSTNWSEPRHRVNQHYSETRILVIGGQQNLSLINQASYSILRQEGVNALVVLRDTRWRDDRSIIGTMEVDLSGDYLASTGIHAVSATPRTISERQGMRWILQPSTTLQIRNPREVRTATLLDDIELPPPPGWGDEENEAVFPSIWEDTPWEEDPFLELEDLPAEPSYDQEEEEEREAYFLGLEDLENDYPSLSLNSVLQDENNQQLPPYWDNNDPGAEEYWQQVVEQVEQLEEQIANTEKITEGIQELAIQEVESSSSVNKEEPNEWLKHMEEAAHVGRTH